MTKNPFTDFASDAPVNQEAQFSVTVNRVRVQSHFDDEVTGVPCVSCGDDSRFCAHHTHAYADAADTGFDCARCGILPAVHVCMCGRVVCDECKEVR